MNEKAFVAKRGGRGVLRMSLWTGVFACVLALSGVASAQTAGSYTTATTSSPFVTMTDGISLGLSHGSYTSTASGAPVTLGFPMSFFGKTYTDVYVNTAGQVLFGATNTSTKTKPYSTKLGDSTTPNAWVSPWWGYSTRVEGTDDVRYKITGGAGSHVATFQWTNYGYYATAVGYPRSMQVVLKEATRTVELRYGPQTTTSYAYDYGAAGAEDTNGTTYVSALSCNTNSSGCYYSSWPASGTTFTMTWLTPTTDLVTAVNVDSIKPVTVNNVPQLQVSLTVNVNNLGKTAATDFGVDFYTSQDAVIDPASDTKITSHATPITLAAQGTATFQETITIPRPANGELYIGAIVDPANVVAEADETNNTAASDVFSVGTDLAVKDVSGPASAGLLDTVTIKATISNKGTDPATAAWGVYVSSDKVIDPATDTKIGEVTFTLNGSETRAETLTGKVPNNLYVGAGSTLYWGVYADPQKTVTETTRANNGAASTGTVDLVLPDVASDNRVAAAPEYYFGAPATVDLDVVSQGLADAHDVTVLLMLSDNAVITLNDTQIAEIDHLEIPKGTKQHLQFKDIILPERLGNGQAYPVGNYYFGIIIDPDRQIPETNEANNAAAVTPSVHLRRPAPDFQAVRVDGPLNAAGGDVVSIARTIRNVGNRGNDLTGKAYRYRYYLSDNQLISAEDRQLNLMVGGVEREYGTGRLPAGGEDRGVDLVKIPANFPAGSFFLGLVVDSDGEIDELREDNNVVASGALVTVAGGGLTIDTGYLPDATSGVAYLHQLLARGGDGTYAWRVVPGQGELPPGMTLSPTGTLGGIPTAKGQYLFAVEASSMSGAAHALLAIRVFAPQGPLAITTAGLPAAIETRPYGSNVGAPTGVVLTAAGGVPPYRWVMSSDSTLPNGMTLTAAGLLSGTPGQGSSGDYTLDLTVTDAVGSTAETQLKLKVVQPGSLYIDTRDLPPDAATGQPYTYAFPLIGGKAPFKPLVTAGGLPEGTSLTSGADRIFLTGKPVRAGVFSFTLQITDSQGVQVARPFVIVVRPGQVNITTDKLPEAVRGETYKVQLSADSTDKLTWRLASGTLPAGLSITEFGELGGSVNVDAAPQAYDFLVEARDRSGSRGVAALTIVVQPPPDEAPKAATGCSTGGSELAPFAMWAAAILLRRRRAARHDSTGAEAGEPEGNA